MKQNWMVRVMAAMVAMIVCTATGLSYMVSGAVSLDELTSDSQIIFKGIAIDTQPVEDEWFKPYPGYTAHQTQFRVVNVIKGDYSGNHIKFRHYDSVPAQVMMFMPQNYHFEPGRSYIVCAVTTDLPGATRQLWMYHKSMEDQGVLLCADADPVTTDSIRTLYWNELTGLLRSEAEEDVMYGMKHLDEMSDSGRSWFGELKEFSRAGIIETVHGLMHHPSPKIADYAIEMIGTHNPYMSEERTQFWLATVGSAEIRGIGKMDREMENPGGAKYRDELVALANSDAPAERRARAILALGLVREPALKPQLEHWQTDPDAPVRAAAAVLSADYPDPVTVEQLKILAEDTDAAVRAAMARAAGFMQSMDLVGTLAALLHDPAQEVRRAAAMSLLSFSPADATIAGIFRDNLNNEEFEPLFLNALAHENPEPYLDGLVEAIEHDLQPENFWGGMIPAFDAWNMLFKYVQGRSLAEVRSGKLDRYFDALEMGRNYSSSEPRDLYALYLNRELTERANAYRAKAKQTHPYDIDYYFDMVDKNPAQYTRDYY